MLLRDAYGDVPRLRSGADAAKTEGRNLNDPVGISKLEAMAEITDTNVATSIEVEQLTRSDLFRQILTGVGIASGLALLWTMESMRNVLFRILNALHIPARHRRRGSAFPAGQARS